MAQQQSTRRDINIGRQGPNNLILLPSDYYHLIKNYCISRWFVYIIFDEMPWNILKLLWPDLEFLIGHIFCPKVRFRTPSWDQNQPHSCHIFLLLQWFILKQTTTSGAFWLFMHCWFCFCLFFLFLSWLPAPPHTTENTPHSFLCFLEECRTWFIHVYLITVCFPYLCS